MVAHILDVAHHLTAAMITNGALVMVQISDVIASDVRHS